MSIQPTNRARPCISKWFSESNVLAELACLIDATPPEFRLCILKASLELWPGPDFDSSYLVGTYRSRLFDCLYERLDRLPDQADIREVDASTLRERLEVFANATDVAQTTLALCDLVTYLCGALSNRSAQ